MRKEGGGRNDTSVCGSTRPNAGRVPEANTKCRRLPTENAHHKNDPVRFYFLSELKSNVGYISEALVMKPVQILQLQARMSWHRPIGGLISTAARVACGIPSLCGPIEVAALSLDPPGPTAVGAEQRAVATLTGVDRALPPVGPPGHP